MSQLSPPDFPIEQINRFIKLEWSDFVRRVLQLTVVAYQMMRRARVARPDWEENAFTECLSSDFLCLLAFDNNIVLTVREKVHTPQMRDGNQPTIQAKEMDLSLFGTWEQDYRKIRFVWEAKRVGDKRIDKKYSKFNSEYVNEAIYRFIKQDYAATVSDAGVLGYVLAGSVDNIVNDINASMGSVRKNPALPKTDHLRRANPIEDFTDVYHSRHKRTDATFIKLHHLLLTFCFE